LAVLHVDDSDGASAAEERDGEKGFVTVFGKLVEELEARILGSIARDGYWFEVLGNPSGDTLADLELKAVENFGVGILGSAEHKFLVFQHVNEARIALDQGGGELNDAIQDFVERVGSGHAAAEFVKEIYFQALTHQQRTHGLTVGPSGRGVQSYFLMEKIRKTGCANVCRIVTIEVGYTAMKNLFRLVRDFPHGGGHSYAGPL